MVAEEAAPALGAKFGEESVLSLPSSRWTLIAIEKQHGDGTGGGANAPVNAERRAP